MQHMSIRFLKINHHMALVGLCHIKEEVCKGFSKFSNKVPKHLNNKERRSLLAPTNVTSDDARRRQFGVAVFHEPRMNPQAHGIPL